MPSIRKSFQCSVKVLATASLNASNDWFDIRASLQLIVSAAIFVTATAEYKSRYNITYVEPLQRLSGPAAHERGHLVEMVGFQGAFKTSRAI
jgi:hypothetical protein